jgi:hypothetical protein
MNQSGDFFGPGGGEGPMSPTVVSNTINDPTVQAPIATAGGAIQATAGPLGPGAGAPGAGQQSGPPVPPIADLLGIGDELKGLYARASPQEQARWPAMPRPVIPAGGAGRLRPVPAPILSATPTRRSRAISRARCRRCRPTARSRPRRGPRRPGARLPRHRLPHPHPKQSQPRQDWTSLRRRRRQRRQNQSLWDRNSMRLLGQRQTRLPAVQYR